MNIMKIKSNKVSIVRAHSQGSFLLVNPSIPTYFSLVVLESLYLLLFSNSLIIHMVISQSECPILVSWIYLDTQ